MKLNKAIKKTVLASMTVLLAAALSFTGCSSSTGSDDNNTTNNTSNKKDSSTSTAVYSGDEITFTAIGNSVNSTDTILMIKYDRSAKGVDEKIALENVDLDVTYNDEKIPMGSKISFDLDEYGSSFDNAKTPITNPDLRKEYKAKININKKISTGDVVKVQLKKANISGAGKDTADIKNMVIALIDTNQNAGGVANSYYYELCSNTEENKNEYLPLITKKDGKDLSEANTEEQNNPGQNPAAEGQQIQGTTVSLSGFDGWEKYTVSASETSVTISHDAAVAANSCCGMDINLGENDTVTLKIKNNSATEKAYAKISLKNDTWSTANGYKSGLLSAIIRNNPVADVSYGALATIEPNEEVQVVLVYNTTLAACDKFVVSLNSEAGTMPSTGNITISSCVAAKTSNNEDPNNGNNGGQTPAPAAAATAWEGNTTFTNWEKGEGQTAVNVTLTSNTVGLKITWSASETTGVALKMQDMNWGSSANRQFKKSDDTDYSDTCYLWPASTTTEFTFKTDELEVVRQYGVQVYGDKITITKVELIESN